MANLFLGGEIPPGFQAVPKALSGKQVYLLAQPDLATPRTVNLPPNKTTVATANPVMKSVQSPMLDAGGIQKQYEVTRSDVQPDGSILQVGTGQFLKLWRASEVQDTDGTGHPLFWKPETATETVYVPQAPLEILDTDPEYVEGLPLAYELVAIPTPEPSTYVSPEERIRKLEASLKDTRKDVALVENKADATTADLGGFMDLYFTRTP